MVTGATLVTVLSTGVVFTHTLQLLLTHTDRNRIHACLTLRTAGVQVCRYLGNGVQRAALGVAVTDAHPAHRDVFDGVIILTRQVHAVSVIISSYSFIHLLFQGPSDGYADE